jgi:hypothetical protein
MLILPGEKHHLYDERAIMEHEQIPSSEVVNTITSIELIHLSDDE